jgi:pimeloyl-ACP methyl ester carboxylesterase
VVTVDLPGFGASGKELEAHWKFDRYTEDIQNLISQLKLKNVVLIGHSMSGDLILDVAKRYPAELAGIVGVDNLQEPAPLFAREELKSFDSFFSEMVLHFDSIVKVYMPSQLFQPSTDTLVRKRVMKDILANEPSLAVKVLKENAYFSQQQRTAMQSLPFPLLLISSDVNPVNDSLLGLHCAKGYRVKTIPGCGHYPMIEQPENFNRALEQLLDALSVR